jgi:hypothetical protein
MITQEKAKRILDSVLLQRRQEQIALDEVNYSGNVGIAELFTFYERAKKNQDHFTLKQVDDLIKRNRTKKAWKIVLDYLGLTLSNKT